MFWLNNQQGDGGLIGPVDVVTIMSLLNSLWLHGKAIHNNNSIEHWEFDSSLSRSSLPPELGWIQSGHDVAEIGVVPMWQDRRGHDKF